MMGLMMFVILCLCASSRRSSARLNASILAVETKIRRRSKHRANRNRTAVGETQSTEDPSNVEAATEDIAPSQTASSSIRMDVGQRTVTFSTPGAQSTPKPSVMGRAATFVMNVLEPSSSKKKKKKHKKEADAELSDYGTTTSESDDDATK